MWAILLPMAILILMWDFSGIVENINAIIDKIQAHNPNITIIIEQLAPMF